jgi:hypothetical protein
MWKVVGASSTHTHTHARTHARTYARAHTRTYARARAHTNTHTHVNTQTHARTDHEFLNCYTGMLNVITYSFLTLWIQSAAKWTQTDNQYHSVCATHTLQYNYTLGTLMITHMPTRISWEIKCVVINGWWNYSLIDSLRVYNYIMTKDQVWVTK